MPSPATAVAPGASRAGETRGGFWEEAHDAAGAPRSQYAAVLADLDDTDPVALADTMAWSARVGGVAFHGAAGLAPCRVGGGKDTWVLRS
jgi:hypothetical protein